METTFYHKILTVCMMGYDPLTPGVSQDLHHISTIKVN